MDSAALVLVAEDDEQMRRLLVRALGRDGHSVVEVEDGFELFDYLECVSRGEVKRPALVVTDVRMPGRTGLEVIERLRGLDRSLPVLVITAFPDSATRDRATLLGVTRMLDKPFDMDDFRAAVRHVLADTPAQRTA